MMLIAASWPVEQARRGDEAHLVRRAVAASAWYSADRSVTGVPIFGCHSTQAEQPRARPVGSADFRRVSSAFARSRGDHQVAVRLLSAGTMVQGAQGCRWRPMAFRRPAGRRPTACAPPGRRRLNFQCLAGSSSRSCRRRRCSSFEMWSMNLHDHGAGLAEHALEVVDLGVALARLLGRDPSVDHRTNVLVVAAVEDRHSPAAGISRRGCATGSRGRARARSPFQLTVHAQRAHLAEYRAPCRPCRSCPGPCSTTSSLAPVGVRRGLQRVTSSSGARTAARSASRSPFEYGRAPGSKRPRSTLRLGSADAIQPECGPHCSGHPAPLSS